MLSTTTTRPAAAVAAVVVIVQVYMEEGSLATGLDWEALGNELEAHLLAEV